jgi:hypothetical protein
VALKQQAPFASDRFSTCIACDRAHIAATIAATDEVFSARNKATAAACADSDHRRKAAQQHIERVAQNPFRAFVRADQDCVKNG